MTTTSPVTASLAAQYEERVARAIEQEEAHRDEAIAQAQRVIAAGDEPGFSGDLRRAIHSGGVKLETLADAAQIHVFTLCDFLEGLADLTSTQIAAIAQLLGLLLVRPFPIDPPRKPRPPTPNPKE